MKTEIVDLTEFEPNILMFACNWCSYAGLDLAGTSRMRYPPNVKVIRTMCSGRVDLEFIVKALSEGVDGVIIGMCNKGDCHYIDGNYKALKRFELLLELLDKFGIERERVRIEGISAAEAPKAQRVITEMVETLKKLGPIKIKEE